jgi:3-deoxy-D-manno-octulosonic-acid transferase
LAGILVRYLYIVLLTIALPFILLRQWWRARRQPGAFARLGERVGRYPFKLHGAVWVHAVSVGEVIAAIPLIKALQVAYAGHPVIVTTMTTTGAARVKAAFGDTVRHAYLAYDTPGGAHRFLAATQPVLGVIMETEIWPNLLLACEQKNVPVCLVNARLSEKSAKGYARFGSLTRETLCRFAFIACAAESDAKRFLALGANPKRLSVSGNIKYDLVVSPNLIAEAVKWRDMDRPFVWVAASTHEGEESIILAAHQRLREHHPKALLILVPRHPERFDAIFSMCSALFKTERRSLSAQCHKDAAVYLGDTMGELLFFYAVSDVAFVGGSLIPRGGHNILEPAALAKPIISGTHVFNFETIMADFTEAKAMSFVNNADDLAETLIAFAGHAPQRRQQGERAFQLMESKRGVLQRQLTLIKQLVAPTA